VRLLASLVALLAATSARALEVPERPLGHLSDFAHALSLADRGRLDAELASYDNGTQQIAIAIFPSLEGESLEDFSIRLAEKWKIGGKKNSDGVLVTVFVAEHKIRVEVGYGLEDRLTDARSAQIIREIIAPHFQRGDVAGGLSAGALMIHRVITEGADALPPPSQTNSSDHVPIWIWILIFLVVVAILSRSRGGGAGPFIGGTFLGGSSGWSSGGGGGGGGGFSGGGGSFGGGGASGSW
jgi:uncharacterized protein